MARVRAVAWTESAVSIAANTTTYLLGLNAPANQAVAVKRVTISAEGVAATDKPALVEFGTATVSTGTATACTERQIAGPTVTLQGAASHTYTVAPTSPLAYQGLYMHLQSGYEKVFQTSEDEWVLLNTLFWVRLTNPTGNSTTNIRCAVEWEE